MPIAAAIANKPPIAVEIAQVSPIGLIGTVVSSEYPARAAALRSVMIHPPRGPPCKGGAAHSPNLAVGFSCADRAGIPVVRTVLGIAAALATPVAREIGRRAIGRCSRSRARRFAPSRPAKRVIRPHPLPYLVVVEHSAWHGNLQHHRNHSTPRVRRLGCANRRLVHVLIRRFRSRRRRLRQTCGYALIHPSVAPPRVPVRRSDRWCSQRLNIPSLPPTP